MTLALVLAGFLLREGKPLDFTKAPIYAHGVHCREPDQKGIELQLILPASASPYNVEDKVVAIGAKPGETKLNMKLDARNDLRVLAWISGANRASQSEYPDSGWVRFTKLDRTGPIEADFELDFGKLGKISGTGVAVDKSEEITCVIPAPPPPPPRSK